MNTCSPHLVIEISEHIAKFMRIKGSNTVIDAITQRRNPLSLENVLLTKQILPLGNRQIMFRIGYQAFLVWRINFIKSVCRLVLSSRPLFVYAHKKYSYPTRNFQRSALSRHVLATYRHLTITSRYWICWWSPFVVMANAIQNL